MTDTGTYQSLVHSTRVLAVVAESCPIRIVAVHPTIQLANNSYVLKPARRKCFELTIL